MKNNYVGHKYSFLWVTLLLFLLAFSGHWVSAWFSYIEEQKAHRVPIEVTEYIVETTRDTLENWQSEFLQLIWQVAGLTYFLYAGSPQSKEGDERKEEKIDEILRHLKKDKAENLIAKLDKKYPKN